MVITRSVLTKAIRAGERELKRLKKALDKVDDRQIRKNFNLQWKKIERLEVILYRYSLWCWSSPVGIQPDVDESDKIRRIGPKLSELIDVEAVGT